MIVIGIIIVILLVLNILLQCYTLYCMKDALEYMVASDKDKNVYITELQKSCRDLWTNATDLLKDISTIKDTTAENSAAIKVLQIRANSDAVNGYYAHTAKGPTRVKYPGGHVYIPDVGDYSGLSLFEAPDQENDG